MNAEPIRTRKTRMPKKQAAENAPESIIAEPAIVEPTPEIATEPDFGYTEGEMVLGLEDKSKLHMPEKLQTIINLLKVLPVQYKETEEQLKRNIWNIARFEPTNSMIAHARESIDNEPQRTQR
jgi:hypothetical protein